MPHPGKQVTIDLAVRDNNFSVQTIIVPAGADVAINFHNDDAGILHNFAVYTDSTATTAVFQGLAVKGPDSTFYRFTAPTTPGVYFFRCDCHTDRMWGTFVVQ